MSETTTQPGSIPLDQRESLDRALERLIDEFAGAFGRETVTALLDHSYASVSHKARMPQFVPLLAERFARQRLQASSHRRGAEPDPRPAVLFLCVHNAGKSQMALGLFEKHAARRAVAWSGGSEPGHALNADAVAAMAEIGIDITGEFPKPWTEETLRAADVIVTMGCGDTCPYYPGKRYVDWTFDGNLSGPEGARNARDQIETRVVGLLEELGVAVTA
ncbi:arsenate reductase ArsC [Demequina capsici]|uniref:Arsenate reductase ArsC n=1 Tax=Demequina capsici TaxID=3075620 RepID=A0AA96F7H0_9MICO|nr:arsenate reductase ArsC [Demequina sp. OYTSA14]WNM24892.1 arsenate reductase ArsC [Demequina sp. OYTSA14]